MNTNVRIPYKIGDTFMDRRSEDSNTVTIVEITDDGLCFQLRSSDKPEEPLYPYVTEGRLLEITGGADPVSHIEDEPHQDIDQFEPQRLIPADTVSAHIHPRLDGTIVVHYYAQADVWNVLPEVKPRALRNEVQGRILLDGDERTIVEAAAQVIESSLFPYRLSPETLVGAHLFPEKRSLTSRLRLKIFGGAASVPNDPFTDAFQAALYKRVQNAAPSSTPVLTNWD